jgi:hypothetical protein
LAKKAALNLLRGAMLRINAALVVAASLLAGTAHAAGNSASVPTYNITSACHALSAIPEARTVDSTQPDVTNHCIEAEKEAREQLLKQWSQFSPADRSMCVGVSSAGSVDPVYTELITCLEMTRDSKQLTAKGATPKAVPTDPRQSAQIRQSQ